MTWKPPPIFGGKKKCDHDTTKSVAIVEFALDEGARDAITKCDIVKDNVPSIVTVERRCSAAWKPPPCYVAAEEEERKEQVFEEGTSEGFGVFSPVDILCDINRGMTLNTITSPRVNDPDGRNDEFVAIVDENQKQIQKNIIETFRPFRNDIARYVEDRFQATRSGISERKKRQNNSFGHIDCVGNNEYFTKVSVTDVEDCCINDKNVFPKMEISPKSIPDRELFAFWEGVHMSVQASIHVADVSQQRPSQTVSISLPSPLLPPYVAQTPRKFRSIRSEQKSDNSVLTRSQPPSTVEEKWDDSVPLPTNASRRRSIASIRHETDTSTTEVTTTAQGSSQDDAKKIQKLLLDIEEGRKYQRRLEKQLKSAGIAIAEDIPYDVAKQKVSEIAMKLSELSNNSRVASTSDQKSSNTEAEYFKLEREMEKYVTALELTDEWISEQEEEERKWEEAIEEDNTASLGMVLRHMPVDIRNQSEAQLAENPTPNGKFLPRSIVRKFKRTNCLQLLRMDPMKLIFWHPSMLENLSVTGLTLTERRALHQYLKPVGAYWKERSKGGGDKMLERKLVWFETMKSNFKECLFVYERHIDLYGPPGNHPHAASSGEKGCPMVGKQCPVKANQAIDYSGDYGYPKEAVYFDETNDDPAQSSAEVGRTFNNRSDSTKTKGPVRNTWVSDSRSCRAGLLAEIKGHGYTRGGPGRRGFSGMSRYAGRQCPANGSLMNEIQRRGCRNEGAEHEMRFRVGTHIGGRSELLAAIQAREGS